MNGSATAFARLVAQARSRIEEVSPEELFQVKPLPVIIDLRELDQYDESHVAGAKQLSRGVLEQMVCEVVPNFFAPIVVCVAIAVRGPHW